MTDTDTSVREYSKEETLQIARSLGLMPYAGILGPSHQPKNVDELCRWLDAFAERLAAHAVSEEEKESKLRVLQWQRDAARSFLGIEDIVRQVVREERA